jgi:hypothetical protein
MVTHILTLGVHEIGSENENGDGIRGIIMLLCLKNIFWRRECPRKTYAHGLWLIR